MVGRERRDPLNSFIKTAQYLASLTAQQDGLSETVNVLMTFFGTDLACFGERLDNGAGRVQRLQTSGECSCDEELLRIVEGCAVEVLETGFIALAQRGLPDPWALAGFPIIHDKRTERALIVGHRQTEPLAREQLDLYLAVAGLASSTLARLASEAALQRHRDELEQQVAERTAELSETSTFLQTVIDAFAYPLIVIDAATYRIKLSNSAVKGVPAAGNRLCYEVLFGRSEPCPLSGLPCPLEEVKRSGEPTVLRRTLQGPAGEVRTIEMNGHPVTNDRGEVVQIIEYSIDITDRLQEEERFSQARRMEVVGQLAGGVAHHFNNQLTGLIGFAEFAHNGLPAHHRARRNLSHVLSAGHEMAELTRHLLAFARRQLLQRRELDLNTFIRVNGQLLAEAAGPNTSIEYVLATDLRHVRADASQLEYVLTNIVRNAGQAMPGGGHLTVETANVTLEGDETLPGGAYVKLAVTDTGKGMDEETLARVFEPFFNGKGLAESAGLGLAVVYGIVKQHGGDILAHSVKGKGSRFEVYFPRYEDED